MRDFAPLLERAFERVPDEGTCTMANIEGELPDYVRGSCFVNGPARFRRNGLQYRHWLDGDGMVCALRFSSAKVEFANRFVRTTKLIAEDNADRPIYRTFGTSFDGDEMKRGIALESPGNVSVYPFAGKLLAFGEQGLPWELDPGTLATRNLFDFKRGLNELSPFSAHPKVDRFSGEMYNFGVAFGSAEPACNLYRISREATLVSRKRLALDYPSTIHDFALTLRFAVLHAGPYVVDMQSLRSGATLLESLRWRPDLPARMLVIDRDLGRIQCVVTMPAGYVLHLIDAFDSGPHVTVDLVLLDRPVYDQYQPVPDLFQSVGRGRPVRITADVDTGEVLSIKQLRYDCAPDFPSIDPRTFGRDPGQFWMVGVAMTGRHGRKFFDQLVHASWDNESVSDVWTAPAGCYIGSEPIFIGNPDDEVDGVILIHLFDAALRMSRFVVFHAAEVRAGPIASIPLESPMHLAFHGSFLPEIP